MSDIVDFAIAREEESYDFYTSLAASSRRPGMRAVFEQFAQEELGHKAKLQSAGRSGRLVLSRNRAMDLKLADYLVAGDTTDDMDYQQALIVSMQKEKASFRLYTDLADRVDDDTIQAMLLTLAQEEARHKVRFEVEYDEFILTEN